MIKSIKNKLWDLLSKKQVSLVMIYDDEGKILWNKGRDIIGKTVVDGDGYCKSVILDSLKKKEEIYTKDEYITFSGERISESAGRLLIKNIIIQPINDFYLYIDSGDRIAFSQTELGIFKMLGNLLGEAILQIKKKETELGGISGDSAPIKRIKELVIKFSLEEDCIILLGETGVGKTHIAELIHNYSGRKGQFIVADASTINENLFESEIFGHKKGAFTGAIANKRGMIDEADEGTLFFDEIAEVPISFQAKLLRFIEKKKYRILGNPIEQTADVRIVAATNRDLHQMIEDKEFREDLFYRLNIFSIRIPPLRERKEDIKKLVEDNIKFLKGKAIGKDFWDIMLNYYWPGNCRELFSVLKRAGVLCDGPVKGKDVQEIINENLNLSDALKNKNKIDSIWQRLLDKKSFWEVVKEPFLKRELNLFEVKEIVSRALLQVGGKYIDALDILNIDRSDYKKFIKFLHRNKLR